MKNFEFNSILVQLWLGDFIFRRQWWFKLWACSTISYE